MRELAGAIIVVAVLAFILGLDYVDAIRERNK